MTQKQCFYMKTSVCVEKILNSEGRGVHPITDVNYKKVFSLTPLIEPGAP